MQLKTTPVALAILAAGCGALEPPPQPPQDILVRVSSDPGRAVKGAQLVFNGRTVTTTDDDGVGLMKLEGKDGEVFDISVRCPEGFQSPQKPTAVILKRLAESGKRPEYSVTCPPNLRNVVVAVRAEGGPNLPVLYMGREVARTDASGAAHVLFTLKPEEQLDLILGTSEKGNEMLRPQNPSSSFFVKQRDDLFSFDQKFVKEKPRPKPAPKGRPAIVKI